MASNVTPVLEFKDVTVAFDANTAVDHISLTVRQGQSAVILGAAGSGKTTLLKSAIGLVRCDSGHIDLFGQDITVLDEHALYPLRAQVGILFQEGGVFDSLNIEDNVAYPLRNTIHLPEGEVPGRVLETLRFVELEHTLEKYPSELSGGMRRRVGIARAVVTEPRLCLYDSPTAGLDPITANTIMALLVKERDLKKTTTVMVTHRIQDGQILANFRYNPETGQLEPAAGSQKADLHTVFVVLRDGRLVFEGSEEELQSSSDPYISKFARR
ncbi:MAG: ATP-binding cassette domain-containing protein [Bryobacteraceae bacterium]